MDAFQIIRAFVRNVLNAKKLFLFFIGFPFSILLNVYLQLLDLEWVGGKQRDRGVLIARCWMAPIGIWGKSIFASRTP